MKIPFKPGIGFTLVLLVLAILFVSLGQWQLQRKAEKQALFQAFEEAPSMALSDALARQQTFARVSVSGRFDQSRHILIDNRVHNGRAGVEVLTPFYWGEDEVSLVNRGWLPMPPDRRSLPVVDSPAGSVKIEGILSRPPAIGPRLGEEATASGDGWPVLLTWFDTGVIEQTLDISLENWVVLLEKGQDGGFDGPEWSPAVMPPKTHGAYALQWFSLALTALIIWIIIGVRRAS